VSNVVDQQLKKNDCGISAVKTVCNILDVDISRDIIEDHILLDQEGSSLASLNKFLTEYGFATNFKLFDLNAVNGNQAELSEMFPCIVPVKNRKGLHYVVVNGLRNYKFTILDPSKKRPYKLTLQEFKNRAVYSSASLDYVDVEELLQVQVNNALRDYEINLDVPPTQRELAEMFNKIVYFSYVEENYGFKNKTAAKEFLKDLIFNQELSHIPKKFQDVSFKREKVKIKAPVFLSIKKTESTKEDAGRQNQNVYWRLFKTISSIKNLWYIFICTSILASIISYVSVFINQILIDHVLPSYELNTLKIFAVGVGAFFLIDRAFRVYKRFVSIHLSNAFDRFFMSVLDKKLSTYSIRYLQSYRRGDLTERLRDTMRLKSFFTRYFASILVDVIIATTSLIFLFMINWKLSMIVLFVLVLFAVMFVVFTPIIEDLERQRYTQKASFMSKFIEKIEGIQSIKAMCLENYSSQQINQGIEELIQIHTKSRYVGMFNSVLTSVITAFASLALLVLTSREMIVNNAISLGMIITFLALSNKIFSAFSNLLDKNLSIQENKVILNRFFDFDENKSLRDEDELNAQENGTSPSIGNRSDVKGYTQINNFDFNSLSVKDVGFTYNNDTYVLKNVNLEIKSGEKISIRGRNGSGKSTLCKILGMLYTQTDGEMQINDIDISLYNKKKLRKKIVFVSGEDLLFNETLLFNISFGRKINMQKLIAYSKILGLYDFIQKKHDKFEFMIYENGRNLSTGQRKKVLLLRALMTEAKVIILDEIFNGLDKESKAMTEELIQNINDRAFIIISHMPTDNIHFNQEYDIKNGILLKKAA